jgi:cytochrome c-type biogenesis protein CcmF
MQVGEWTIAYRELDERPGANATLVRAQVDLVRDGRVVRRVEPGKNRYPVEQEVSNEMAIYTNWLTGEDVDVIADQIDPDGAVFFRVLVKPLVNLIWLSGLVFIAGALVAMWPDAREQRRLAIRYAGVRPAET